jgi:16S rRNA (guanine966-N2)-methyltransferase
MLRGRFVHFNGTEIRPTKSTVRKTLFNWLRPSIQGAVCLDCFSGSGILAFEAISEGAASVTCMDKSPAAIRGIEDNKKRMGIAVIDAKVHKFPKPLSADHQFDLVFLDPPFDHEHIVVYLDWLLDSGCLKKGGFIYIEQPKPLQQAEVPQPLRLFKSARTAGVYFSLLKLEDGHE